MQSHTKKVDGSLELKRRIHMVQGQLDGVLRMMEEDRSCVDVLTQFKAAQAGIERAFSLFLEARVQQCVGAKDLSVTQQHELHHIIGALVK